MQVDQVNPYRYVYISLSLKIDSLKQSNDYVSCQVACHRVSYQLYLHIVSNTVVKEVEEVIEPRIRY